ncbi:hypothetical protein [Aggregatibacter actinomycetemcomitans]|uniref:hypothetical protein n=1 Tax=Aggregatibacter actinomycetemcomitans TaxID=714 RepID=UPI00197C1A0C|nr:hypothetical protein [Aggregatibacter actinomycetemcomitans]MBN6064312.1 hypothetical protein [Aggregatibacter actinomycetemcomitans]MBN6084248.1 hypothetical protein [Aggregatibacter actinomycetemcomitans]
MNPPAGKDPSEPLPTAQLDNSQWQNDSVAWLGHSTTLFKTGDVAITFVPTRLSGRTLGADNLTLWGGHSKKRFLK